MCGRFALDPTVPAVRAILDAISERFAALHFKTGEIFPTDSSLVLVEEDGKMMPKAMIWGFPRWDGKGVVFNARAETALSKSLFSKALRTQRVVVLTSGFFEWTAEPGRKKKVRHLFRTPGKGVTGLAGFFSTFEHEGLLQERYTILTTAANEAMMPYHERMPILLHRDEWEDWLRGAHWEKFLSRIPFALEAFRQD